MSHEQSLCYWQNLVYTTIFGYPIHIFLDISPQLLWMVAKFCTTNRMVEPCITCWNPINNGMLPIKSINMGYRRYLWISPQDIPIEIPMWPMFHQGNLKVAKRTVAAAHPATFLGTLEVSEAPRGDLRWRIFCGYRGYMLALNIGGWPTIGWEYTVYYMVTLMVNDG